MPRPIHYDQRAGLAPQGRRQQQQNQRPVEPDKAAQDRRVSALRETVLENIGRPDDLISVDILRLWDDDHFRVNVYREVKDKRNMTDSFFVYMVSDGVVSKPAMTRKYHDDMLDAYRA